MNIEAPSRRVLHGWWPIIGAFSIWFAHFLVVYGAALLWPHNPAANIVALAATVPALTALVLLFFKLRSANPRSGQTEFARRFGLGSTFIATAGVLFDAAPALFA